MPRSYLYPFECLPFECLSGREVSPKVPVGAGWFVHEGPSWLARFVCEPERGVKVDSVRVISDRPPPERSESVPCLAFATILVNPFASLIALRAAQMLTGLPDWAEA